MMKPAQSSFRWLLLCLILALLSGTIVLAQEDDAPLVLWVRGDLWRVSAAAPDAPGQPLTQSGYVSGPALSPDGARVAYKTAAAVGIAALDRVQSEGLIAAFDLPADIALVEIATGQTTVIAGQPDDASLLVAGVPDRAIVRSAPVWSPDGTRLAWTEFPFALEQPTLMIYDLVSGTAQNIAAVPAPAILGSAPDVLWGDGGLAIRLIGQNPTEESFLIYDETGSLRSSPRVALGNREFTDWIAWVDDHGTSALGLKLSSGRWLLIDPVSGQARDAAAPVELVSRLAPDTSLALRFGVTADAGFFWEAIDPLDPEAASIAFAGSPGRVTLSPTGRVVAAAGYPTYSAVSLWREGEITPLTMTGSGADLLEVGAVLWGSTVWRVANLSNAGR